jgi:putative transposase
MIAYFAGFFLFLSCFFRSRSDLGLEILALRQQLGVLKRKNPRPRLRIQDRVFWILLRRLWLGRNNVLVIVKPETVVAWHRAGFRLFWRLRSWPRRLGRPMIDAEIRALIRQMTKENPGWGAPRIHGELLKLDFCVSERTVSRYLRRLSPPENSRKLWAVFLHNHREVIAAVDFFTVPTITFRILYCFFIIEHGRRKILHFNVTEHPNSSWITQQLREAFPEPCPYRYALLDRNAKFGKDVTDLLASSGIKPKRIGYRCPWQNGISERWIGSCRRELLDHVIILNESHLRRLIRDYVSYYHEDRIHDSLEKDSPATRLVSCKPEQSAHCFHFRALAACIIATIGSRPHKKAGDQNYDFSIFIGSVFEPVEIISLFAFKGLPYILAILLPHSFCPSRLPNFRLIDFWQQTGRKAI